MMVAEINTRDMETGIKNLERYGMFVSKKQLRDYARSTGIWSGVGRPSRVTYGVAVISWIMEEADTDDNRRG